MTLRVMNPYNQELVFETPYDTNQQIQKKVDQACQTFQSWRHQSVAERKKEVEKCLAYFRTHRNEIAQDLTQQMGKPITEAHNEIKGFFERTEWMLANAEEVLAPDELSPKEGFHRRIEHDPLGVVLDIAAWNYPLLIAVNVVVPALLAGNTVLIKHSAKTPLCGKHFENAFAESSFPGLVTNLYLTHEQTTQLIQMPKIAHVVFTGSVPGGRKVYQDAAQRFIDVGLELGGKDPAYVAQDADLAFTVPNVIEGACYNAGQSCCAIERVYVHHSVYAEFMERAQEAIKYYQCGNPLDSSTTLGPLASKSALSFLAHQVQDALDKGATLLTGGRPLADTKANFFPATLLANVPNHAEVMQEESFGPLVPVLKVQDDQDALQKMNETQFGLTASIWTRDLDRANYFAKYHDAGTIYQNRCDYLDPALPWTGVKDSGKGSSLSPYGFYHLTRCKSIHFRQI
ncbi:aldehyde dehydrogenase family protein [Deltaproteobacteria bacterium TL4]